MNNIFKIASLIYFANSLSNIASATETKVLDIVNKAIDASYYQGHDVKSLASMQIIDKQGRVRTRSITLLRKNISRENRTQKYYVYFRGPADIKKTVFMAWKNETHEDDRWLYLPALDLVKRIAASDERTSFVGAHFFYEDVTGRSIDEDIHELTETNDDYYVIKSTAINPKLVEFSYYINWVDKLTFIPMKTEYYNKNQILYRSYSVKKVSLIEGKHTVVDSMMENNMSGGKTLLNYSEVKYNSELPDGIFTERYLRRPPKQFLR